MDRSVGLPPGLRALVPSLTDELPEVVAEVVALLREEWPDYAQLLADDSDDVLRTANIALLHLVALAEQVPRQRSTRTPSLPLERQSVFEEIGRIEWREGRSLDGLLSAYRAGARVAWRRLAATAVAQGLPSDQLASLAEAVFAFIEELSSASARGYVEEQRAAAAERERLRGQLAELLLSDRSDSTLVAAMALRAGWPLPAHAAVVLLPPADESVERVLSRLGDRCLPVRQAGQCGAVVPDPDAPGRRVALTAALRGSGAVVGTSAPLAELPSTLRVAEAAARLLRTGALTGDPVYVCDHYDTVLVGRDPWLLARLREQQLAPLDGLPAATRERLEETLAAWLAAMGDRNAAAQSLQVHPQTVRYRLRQLQQRFGEPLDDPAVRLRLTLALCWPALSHE